MADSENAIVNNRSTLKEFLASIATIQGDLSNITAPPFVLGEASTVELPQYWADHPALFLAPARGKTPEERTLLVLKWFLGSLKNQQYAGRDPSAGVKKPLNAFLGELFLGSWKNKSEEDGETHLVSEQVSHHPPVTACYLWNEKVGIRAEGFTCQEITFSGSVNIKQKGYAILHVDEHDEDYLIPVPNVKVKGILGGTPYPELQGKYSIVSSRGLVAEVKFEGKGFFGSGTKNGVEATVFSSKAPDSSIFTVEGSWSDKFEIKDQHGKTVESYDVNQEGRLPLTVPDSSEQDPWESRRAWGGVREALRKGDMKGTTDAKSIVEEGQRGMRKDEESQGKEWQRVFYKRVQKDEVFDKLSSLSKDNYDVDKSGGIWKVDKGAVQNTQKPYHRDITPSGQRIENSSNAGSATKGSEPAIATRTSQDQAHTGQGKAQDQRQIEQTPTATARKTEATQEQHQSDPTPSIASHGKEQPEEASQPGYLDQAKQAVAQASTTVSGALGSAAAVIPGLSGSSQDSKPEDQKNEQANTRGNKSTEDDVKLDPAQMEAILRAKYSSSK